VHTGASIPASYAASNRPPVQPMRSIRNGEEGTVMLRVQVLADGNAGQVEVAESSGFPMLDDAAKSAVQNWRFHPAMLDGKPVTEWFRVPITFKLRN
jgi:protein TonB